VTECTVHVLYSCHTYVAYMVNVDLYSVYKYFT